ncbi:MAG TPA: carbohydrate porin, partial [Edaphobacter sp.]
MIRQMLYRNRRQPVAHPRNGIIRRWVETADERCPLACVWSDLQEILDAQDDEPGSTWPAFSKLAERAGRLRYVHTLPARSLSLAAIVKHSMPVLAAVLLVAMPHFAHAQELDLAAASPSRPSKLPEAPEPADPSLTIFPHPENGPYLISGQANIIFQGHGPFHSPYEGPNSLQGRGEYKTSLLGTLFLGLQLHHNHRYNTDALINVESAGGRGISQALGLAGFTNLDVVRNPTLSSEPYIARVQLHQTIGLTNKLVSVARTPFSLATEAPERRLEVHVGKMSMPDFFDINSVGSDSHLQFLNWTIDNNGAWDYAADTRGYTYAAVAEYIDKNWSARYGVGLMPTVANGIDLDWSLRRASGQNMEFELRRSLLGRLVSPDRRGVVRVLSYVNHAH